MRQLLQGWLHCQSDQICTYDCHRDKRCILAAHVLVLFTNAQ